MTALCAGTASDVHLPTAGADNSGLPGMGGVFNATNCHLYHYAGNNPLRYTDPSGESVMDWVHTGLDVVGFVPGIGDVADGANAVLYLCEGDYVNAALSATSMIPLVGDAVSKGGKAVKTAIKHSDDIVAAGRKIAKHSDDIVGVGKQVLKHADDGLSNATQGVRKVSESAGSVKSGAAKVSNHGNSLNTTKPAQGYALRDVDTDEILKFGETTRGKKRYSKKYLNENNAYMDFQAKGSKREMHDWQHEKILDYKDNQKENVLL